MDLSSEEEFTGRIRNHTSQPSYQASSHPYSSGRVVRILNPSEVSIFIGSMVGLQDLTVRKKKLKKKNGRMK